MRGLGIKATLWIAGGFLVSAFALAAPASPKKPATPPGPTTDSMDFLWDAVQEIPHTVGPDGKSYSCPHAGEKMGRPGNVFEWSIPRCRVASEEGTEAVPMDLKAAARIHVMVPPGKKIKAIGVLPSVRSNEKSPSLSKTSVTLAIQFR
jgi:hypothetical protein